MTKNDCLSWSRIPGLGLVPFRCNKVIAHLSKTNSCKPYKAARLNVSRGWKRSPLSLSPIRLVSCGSQGMKTWHLLARHTTIHKLPKSLVSPGLHNWPLFCLSAWFASYQPSCQVSFQPSVGIIQPFLRRVTYIQPYFVSECIDIGFTKLTFQPYYASQILI